MRLTGESRDLLISKNVQLIKNGRFVKNISKLENEKINDLTDVITFSKNKIIELDDDSYASLRRIIINNDFYQIFVFDRFKDESNNSLKVYAPNLFYNNVYNIINRLTSNGYGLNEFCTLCKHINKKEDNSRYRDNYNFWWDLENDFFIFFENTDKVLQAIEKLKSKKFGYDNDEYNSAFSGMYLQMLKTPGVNNFFNTEHLIKNYYYDENNNNHYLEFPIDMTIGKILMIALAISKIDKGNVIFNVNDIDFNIDENTILDEILINNNLNLSDVCHNSYEIEDLINSKKLIKCY